MGLYAVGSRIWYAGDHANESGIGTVTSTTGGPGSRLTICMDDGRRFVLSAAMISAGYPAHGGARFCPWPAYRQWRAECLRRVQEAAR